MENRNIKTNIISSLFWKLMERGGTQGIQFIIQIVLARILIPNDYGTIALIVVFINIANVFVQSGFSTALIQKKDANEIDFSSVFYISLGVAALLNVVFFFTAPSISAFYGNNQLTSIIRVLSTSLFFGAINSIQNAVISKQMQFKKLFFSSLGAILVSGTFGIIFAYAGYGVWALIAQQLLNQFMICIILWFTVKWRPKLLFSFERVKLLFSFGWKLLVASLIETLYMNLSSMIIGKLYNPSILGFYNRGEQFPKLIVNNIDGSIQSVMLPTLSIYQDNKKRMKEIMRRTIVSSSFLIFPMMVGMAVVAELLVKIVLTEKWLPAVPFLQIFCVSYAFIPIHTTNLQAINAIGRSDIFLKLEIVKKIIGIIILLISIPIGVYAIALGQVVSGIIFTVINAYPNKQLLDYSYKEQWSDIMPSLFISICMGIVVYILNFIEIADYKILVLQVISGVVLYIGLAKIFKIESFIYLIELAKSIFNLKSNN